MTAPSGLSLAALLVALVVAAPIFGVLGALFQESQGVFAILADTVLWRYIGNTVFLGVAVGVGAAAIGVGAAWLVTMHRFPGRAVFEWALVLPLAFPAYVLAYAYTHHLDYAGWLPTQFRAAWAELTPGLRETALFGWLPERAPWPEIRSVEGAAVMLTLVLYPYVYLLSRAAFLQQSSSMIDVARTLGGGPWRRFFTVALPMARPAIVTGVALALMETLADYGTVAYFGVQTFATGIYKAWFSYGDRIAAAQLAACLLMFVFALVAIERSQRGARRFQDTRARFGPTTRTQLTGWRGGAAFLLCLAPLAGGFLIPLAMLSHMVLTGPALEAPLPLSTVWNSVSVAAAAALATVGLALLLAYAVRLSPGPITRGAALTASMGYAAPGGVIAVGLLIPLVALDHAVRDALRAGFGVTIGLLLTGSAFALVLAYVSRFMSVALLTAEASLSKVTPTMDQAARSLGERAGGVLRRVHAPIIRGGLLTAALIVFVDVLKELPATMIMRPANFETLAVRANNLARDERLFEAATPSLVIVLAALLPVLLLTREIRRSGVGRRLGAPAAAA